MADVVSLSGEKYNHEVAALFGAGEPANTAAGQIREALALRPVQVEVLHPGDQAVSRALEPESRGIFETLVRAAIKDGQSAVAVHGASLEQRKAAEKELGRLGGDVIHSV